MTDPELTGALDRLVDPLPAPGPLTPATLRRGARRHDLLDQLDARLDRVVAMISDLTDAEFDTALGQVNDQYLYHPDRQVRTAYLEGGALGVDLIMDAVTAARAQAREDAATRAAAEALAQQRTAALRALLTEVTDRPLYARLAADNTGSLRVLRKCGFEVTGKARGYAPGRGEETDELVLALET